jgi:hypothetical protein
MNRKPRIPVHSPVIVSGRQHHEVGRTVIWLWAKQWTDIDGLGREYDLEGPRAGLA